MAGTERFTIGAGVRAVRGGRPTDAVLRQTVVVPGLFSLAVHSAELTHADNDRLEPERIVMVTLSADAHERDVAAKVRAWALPVYHPDGKPEERKQPYVWSDPSRIGPEILKLSDTVKLSPEEAAVQVVAKLEAAGMLGRGG